MDVGLKSEINSGLALQATSEYFRLKLAYTLMA